MSYVDGFPSHILKKRADKIGSYLAENELRALVLLDHYNIRYVSGVLFSTYPLRPSITVVPADDQPFMILNELWNNSVRYQLEHGRGWIEDVRPYLEHVRLTDRTYTKDQIDVLLCETLRERGITKGSIGVDSSISSLTKWLKQGLPKLKFVDSALLLMEMRVRKCQEELDLMRRAGEFSDRAMEMYKNAVVIGKTLLELETEVTHKMAVEAVKEFPEYRIDLKVGHMGGIDETGTAVGRTGYEGKKIRKSDELVVYIVVTLNGYSAENERMFFVGEPTEEQKKVANVAIEAQIKGVEACVAGNKVSDIESAAQNVIQDAGYGQYITHRIGHGIGLGGQEYWLDMPFNHKIMEAGMVTTVEPSICIPGLAPNFHHSDTVIVGEQKPERITKYPKDLEDITIEV